MLSIQHSINYTLYIRFPRTHSSYTWKLICTLWPTSPHFPQPPAPGNHCFIFCFLGFLDSVYKSYHICLPLPYFTSNNETSLYRPKAVVLKCQHDSESPGELSTTDFQASARNVCFPRSTEGPENSNSWQMPSRCCWGCSKGWLRFEDHWTKGKPSVCLFNGIISLTLSL